VTFLATDVNKDGGKIILATGMPSALPDGEDRMLFALTEIVTAPSRLVVRAGVNRGRIFSVDLGGADRRAYTVIGDEVNLAARVAFKAQPGQVVATDTVLSRVRTRFGLTPLEAFRVKGKSEPISAQVVGAALQAGEATLDLVPLVGRAEELARLREVLKAPRDGRGRIVELVGEPGIGKSRLMAELVRHAGDLPLLRVEGGQYGRSTPYFALWAPLRRWLGFPPDAEGRVVARALRARVAALADHLLPWLPLLGVPFGVAIDDTPESSGVEPAFRRARTHALIVELFDQLFDHSLLLTIEDAHWLDQGSADLLSQMLADVGRKPWAVVVTRRDQPDGFVPSPSGALTTLRLGPLVAADAEELVLAATDADPLPAHVLAQLVHRSAGNPLFLQELVTAARTSSGLSELPDTVEAIMAATVDTLEPTDRAVLRSAAVLGARFRVSELATMIDGGSDRARVQEVLARLQHFLIGDGADLVRFRHILLRDVAYEGLPFSARRRLHARAGHYIESAAGIRAGESAELLSLHFHTAQAYDKAWY
jgi:predicted ATPase